MAWSQESNNPNPQDWSQPSPQTQQEGEALTFDQFNHHLLLTVQAIYRLRDALAPRSL